LDLFHNGQPGFRKRWTKEHLLWGNRGGARFKLRYPRLAVDHQFICSECRGLAGGKYGANFSLGNFVSSRETYPWVVGKIDTLGTDRDELGDRVLMVSELANFPSIGFFGTRFDAF